MSQIQGKQLSDSSITTAKIANNAVTDSKVNSTVLVASGANALTGNLSAGGFTITNLVDPTSAQQAATKSYVDAVAAAAALGIDLKDPVRVATTTALETNTRTGNIITKTGNGALPSIDGVSLSLTDRVLVKNEVTGANNGIYFVSDLGSGSTPWTLTRSTDADTSPEVTTGMYTLVKEGVTNSYAGFFLTTADPIILNTTALTFAQFTGVGSLTFGTPVNIGTANSAGSGTEIARANHVHDSPIASVSNKEMIASVTTSDNDLATVSTITSNNALGGYVKVEVNGIGYSVGDGTKTGVCCYFSGDSGSTARAMSAIVSGDTLRWNGSIAGFQLATTDRIDFIYQAF